jgi:hypothetical protein
MGMQNIKGVGMDFVESWKTWEECYRACQGLESLRGDELRQAVEKLLEIPEVGPLAVQSVRRAIEQVRHSPLVHQEKLGGQLDILRTRLQPTPTAATPLRIRRRSRFPVLEALVNLAEQALDVVDVILRRQQSRQVYSDLIHERIGRHQAVAVLRQLNQRQKGGWLRKMIRWPWTRPSAGTQPDAQAMHPETASSAAGPTSFPALDQRQSTLDDLASSAGPTER